MSPTNFFRLRHLFALLDFYSEQTLPLDLAISHYFKLHKSLGSKDRAFIAESIYGMIRWKSLIDFFEGENSSWEKRWKTYQTLHIPELINKDFIPEHIRFGFPLPLYNRILKSHGLEKGKEICLASNAPAPTTVRVNLLKTDREALLKKWEENYQVSTCSHSPAGIIFHKKINFFDLPEFKQGLFEVQDEGSQLIAALVQVEPGQQVLDYCSGSGGKTLAFAPKMQKTGQIFLHDIRKKILVEAKKRLRRAGVQNAQIVNPDDEQKLKKLKKQMDWVLADVPCSGVGTLRRNPDMKWKFSEEMLDRLVGQQRIIFEKALSFVKPDGHIVYATCSLLNEENQEQIDHFIKTYDLEIVGNIFQSVPQQGEMDGFFAAVLRKKQK
ncbi:RsmB/NOP family class I SAM-dependent RNA methyltransferase [Parachlamydia sp. AcF125]|uniref:RsmB/NOP family class I SAM-dependent RNA methyltransferase n=1 Tax=Parachlamydia sp. AcF125 TaxID=2795736 RepID=UPI001BC8E06B|nr:RsmB/NOP family class I SAM-dependent RNA methyltransferase [Parachlamydia sp. AcF125]MBS4167463.1 Ribosomal RNA small subunit methyltransferase B [Parachlamydia sp. AcF125]